MSEVFSSIKVEIFINSAWADVSADVLSTPSPRVLGIGIMSNSILDRVGDVGTFMFSLDNSTANSGGKLGYYTPEGKDRRTGWDPGLRCVCRLAMMDIPVINIMARLTMTGLRLLLGARAIGAWI